MGVSSTGAESLQCCDNGNRAGNYYENHQQRQEVPPQQQQQQHPPHLHANVVGGGGPTSRHLYVNPHDAMLLTVVDETYKKQPPPSLSRLSVCPTDASVVVAVPSRIGRVSGLWPWKRKADFRHNDAGPQQQQQQQQQQQKKPVRKIKKPKKKEAKSGGRPGGCGAGGGSGRMRGASGRGGENDQMMHRPRRHVNEKTAKKEKLQQQLFQNK